MSNFYEIINNAEELYRRLQLKSLYFRMIYSYGRVSEVIKRTNGSYDVYLTWEQKGQLILPEGQ